MNTQRALRTVLRVTNRVFASLASLESLEKGSLSAMPRPFTAVALGKNVALSSLAAHTVVSDDDDDLTPASTLDSRKSSDPFRLDPIAILENGYQHEIAVSQRPLLHELNETWKMTKPFEGKKVLVNAHLTLITLDLIRLLMNAGAEVHVTASSDLAVHKNTTVPLEKAGIPLYRNAEIPAHLRRNFFDIVFDCGAGMLDLVKPTIGMIELTHTDPSLYENISFPVMTVDTSQTKKLETTLGTGNALTRVLVRQAEINIMTALQRFLSPSTQELFATQEEKDIFLGLIGLMMTSVNQWLDEHYLVVGYGKVGQGIASALKNAGVDQKKIYIAEVNINSAIDAQSHGYTTFNLDDNAELASLKKALGKIKCVITATGVQGAVSHYFTLNDFDRNTKLVNMGTPDEYGLNFPTDRVLNRKKPANFMLPYPTEVRYLDPIFVILARAGEYLLQNRNLTSGLHGAPIAMDTGILKKWKTQWGNTVEQPQTKLATELQNLKNIVSQADNTAESHRIVYSLLAQYGAFQVSQHNTTLSCFSMSPRPSQS